MFLKKSRVDGRGMILRRGGPVVATGRRVDGCATGTRGTLALFRSCARRRISRVIRRVTLTTVRRRVPLTGVTIRRANHNICRSGYVGGVCTTRGV